MNNNRVKIGAIRVITHKKCSWCGKFAHCRPIIEEGNLSQEPKQVCYNCKKPE